MTVFFCALLLVSCGKKSEAPLAPAASTGKPAPANGTTETPAEADFSKTLERLTQTVRRYAAEMRAAPKSLDEVVAAGYLTEMPSAPPGKRFVIDDQLRVTLK